MSDDEDQVVSEEEEESEDEGQRMGPPDDGPSEAELAMQKRKAQALSTTGLDEAVQELLEQNREERRLMEEEIKEMRARNERRKRERAEEEARLAQARAEEEASRRSVEEERKRKKEEEEAARKAERQKKMAEFEKYKNPPKPNFVITKKADGMIGDEGEDESENTERKSKEQLEAEKRAILQQRIHPLEISGFDESKLKDKAKELHKDIYRLEAEKYDLEKRFKEQQYDMMELAERARQMNKVGKGGLKRVQLGSDETDKIQERFAGAPAKIEMYSKYERQKDKRVYGERHGIFTGPQYGFAAERIRPQKKVMWEELTGCLVYDESGMPAEEEAPAEEAAPVEEE